jgi:uncharacterized protein YdhG (YjbR/CyaY superfamily)
LARGPVARLSNEKGFSMPKVTPGAKPAKKRTRPQTVDDYLAGLPADARAALGKLRKTIQTAAPDATEIISYQIPTYRHYGPLVAFAAFKDHCGFYVMSPKVMRAHAAELEGYEVGKATIRFPATKPLPAALVTKLVKARIAENERGGKS